jgi:isopentenyl diphosphate isomerase/L-lactate dehydrogenase-like FMN-dependent dehydrogenase
MLVTNNLERQFPNLRELSALLKFELPTIKGRQRRLQQALTIWDLREIAKKRTPQGPFDYTDGAAESEVSLTRSRQAFLDIEFQPNILQDVSNVSLSRTSLGNVFDMPVGIAPTGFTRMMQAEGERAGARAAEKFGIPFTLSTLGTTAIEEVVKAAPTGTNWFQLYMWKDRDASMALVERAAKAGVKNLMLTVDVPVAGARLRDTYNGMTVPPKLTAKTIMNAIPRPEWVWNFLTTPPLQFAAMNKWDGTVGELLDFMFDPTMTFDDLKWIREHWKGTLTVKGVQTLEDAKRCAEYGIDSVLLSNHGGRQLDRAGVPFHMLGQIRKELKSEIEVHLDTGIMHGGDVLAAIAHGAQFTYVGRAYLYGLMAGGQEGVERTLEILKGQMSRSMKLIGVSSLEELEPKHVKILQTHQGLGNLPK